jgi:K+-transporting ATPase ATPase C chain
MKTQWLVSARVLALSLVLLGAVYPLIIFVAGRALFPFRAGGSIIKEENRVLGSDLIAQDFSLPRYFQPRPSAGAYDPTSSGGSNLGPTNAGLFEIYRERISGLDPDISLGAALWQLPRVARARSLPLEKIEELVRKNARPPLFGFVGEWRVNVLEINRRLDQLPPAEKAKEND